MSSLVFRHQHRVTYAECTVGNHVYYGRYLDILEEARGEFFRHLGTTFLQWQERDTILPVTECQLKYRGPARYDDVLTVELWLTQLSRVRLEFSYRLLKADGAEILRATTQHACTTLHEKPQKWPEELQRSFLPYVHLPTPTAPA